MEKMRSLDGKLKHQIDRLMKVSVQGTGDSSGSSSLRPNPLDLLPKGGDDEGSEEEDKPVQSGEFYRAPKMAAAPYKVRTVNRFSCTSPYYLICPSDESQAPQCFVMIYLPWGL